MRAYSTFPDDFVSVIYHSIETDTAISFVLVSGPKFELAIQLGVHARLSHVRPWLSHRIYCTSLGPHRPSFDFDSPRDSHRSIIGHPGRRTRQRCRDVSIGDTASTWLFRLHPPHPRLPLGALRQFVALSATRGIFLCAVSRVLVECLIIHSPGSSEHLALV